MSEEAIAARAREIWLARGQPIGSDVEIWLQAEQELRTPKTSESTAVQLTGRGVVKARKGDKSLTEAVDEALAGRGGLGQGGNAKIIKQTT